MSAQQTKEQPTFTGYQKFVIAIIAILQFTVVLDFMVLSPLGAIIINEMDITTSQFTLVVSAYAFSAGISGLLAAGFADRFDRKKMLLFFYTGFVLGTLFCAVAPGYQSLMMARIVTGIFGGVISAISFAIITDLFSFQVRGRVMGFVQMAFAASQVMGIPVGLLLANKWGWHSPFWMIFVLTLVVGVTILIYLKPVNAHLQIKTDRDPIKHLIKTISKKEYIRGFMATVLLATGGYMLMPLGSAFSTNNLKLSMDSLPVLYGVTGVFSIAFGPLMGRLSDKIGKLKVFAIGTALSILMVGIYTNLGATPLWIVIVINIILFLGITSRMISSSALISGVPKPEDRGAFMSINSSIQQISGGIASSIAGLIVVKSGDEALQNYGILGFVVICSMLVALALIYRLNVQVARKEHHSPDNL